MAGSDTVTVAIVTHNSADVVAACLSALPDAFTDAAEWHVVVVDNASTDATLDIVARTAPGAQVIALGENRGYAAGINAAAATAPTASHLLVLNPDVRLGVGSLAPMLDALRAPGVGIVAPRLYAEDGTLQRSLRRDPALLRALGEALFGGRRAGRHPRWGEVVTDEAVYERPVTADWATGAALLVSAECREAVGDWDETFFLYSEETDYAVRAREAGFALLYEPAAVAVHRGGESSTSPRLWTILTINRVRWFRRRHGLLRGAAFGATVALNEALRAHRDGGTHRAALSALLRPSQRPPETRRSGESSPSYVCFSAQDYWYHNRAHSDFQLMSRVARERKVLFVNSIGMRMPLPGRSTRVLRRLVRKAGSVARLLRHPRPDLPGLAVMTPLVLPFYGSAMMRAFNANLVRWQVRVAMAATGIHAPHIVVTIPTAWDVVQRLPHRSLVANRSDKYSAFTEADQRVIRDLEERMLHGADHVLYASRVLMDDEAPLSRERAVFLDHGVDLEHFRPIPGAADPADLADVPHPRIGFFGGIDDYIIDFDLLERVAQELPDAHLVLVGDATCSMTRLERHPNVHWLGFRPYEEIPAYGRAFDVAVMPWLQNEWIRHCNPIKLKEYLALGLPVVTTRFPEADRYADELSVADDPDDFVARVSEALSDDGSGADARRAAVADSSWERRAARLMAITEGQNR